MNSGPDHQAGRLRVAVVDDEPHARTVIRLLLSGHPEVDLVAECENGVEAAEVLRWISVDLLFLDVQMPGMNGFEVIQQLGERVPPTVFVTAYDKYALQAFEVQALDYLLKPFDEERFLAAFARARERIRERRTTEWARQLLRATGVAPQPAVSSPRRLPVEQGDRIIFVDFDAIDWIEAADQYVVLHVGAKEYLLREALHRLIEKLPADLFAQIHRSHAVNTMKVREVVRGDRGDGSVVLTSGRTLRLSRRYRDGLRQNLQWPL
jgi:two-component system, LytTR family, response regulator